MTASSPRSSSSEAMNAIRPCQRRIRRTVDIRRRTAHRPEGTLMSTVPRRIVTGHDASGRSVVLSDGPTPKTLDIGSAVFHELWATTAVAAALDASEPEPTTRPLRTGPDAGGVVARFTEMSPGGGGADAPHRLRRHRDRARRRDLAGPRRRVADADDRGRRRGPARHQPLVGEPLR